MFGAFCKNLQFQVIFSCANFQLLINSKVGVLFGKQFRGTIVSIGLMFQSLNLCAAEISFEPQLRAAVKYTDNIDLNEDNNQISDTIFEFNPGFLLSAEGSGSSLDVNYSLQALSHLELSERNDVYHQLELNLNTQALRNLVYYDMTVDYEQQILDLRQGNSDDNSLNSENRTNTARFQLSPYIRHVVDGNGILSFRSSYGEVHYEDSQQNDSDIIQFSTGYEQRVVRSQMGWHVEVQQRKVLFDSGENLRFRQLSYGLSFPIASRLMLGFAGGKEQNIYHMLNGDSEVDDSMVFTSLSWSPSERSNVRFSIGDRYFGRVYDFSLEHRTKYSSWNMEYIEDVETTSLQLQPLDDGGQAGSEDIASQPNSLSVSNQPFVTKRMGLIVSGSRGKMDYNFDVFNSRRQYQLDSGEEKTYGISASYTLRFFARSAVTGFFDWSKSLFSVDNTENKATVVRVDLSRRLRPSISTYVSYALNRQKSNVDVYNYKSNLISFNLNAQF